MPTIAWVPTLSSHEVASVAPVHRVTATGSVGVSYVSSAIRPEGVEVAVVSTLGVGGDCTLLDESGVVGIVTLVEEVERSAHHAGHSRKSDQKRFDSNHGES